MLLLSDPVYGKLAASSVLGMNMSGPYYLAAAVVFEYEPEENIAALAQGEENGAFQVSFVDTQDRRVYAAIVNLDSADDAEMAITHMDTLLRASSWKHILSVSFPFTNISEMPDHYTKALSDATKRLNKLKGKDYSADSDADTAERARLNAGKDEETRRQETAIIDYINENYDRWNFDLEELVDRCGVSKRTAARIVRDRTGKQFREHVISLRIEKAKELLRTGQKVGDISKSVGYSYTHYFIQSFKKATGTTPGEWVKKQNGHHGNDAK